MPNAPAVAMTPEWARRTFVEYAKHAGERLGRARPLLPVGPHGECWSNAWDRVARNVRNGAPYAYCEGVVLVPTTGRDRQWIAHAWVMDGLGAILEPTDGYAEAIEYRGWRFAYRSIEAATLDWDAQTPRSSVVEAALANGIPTEQAVYWLRIEPR